MKILFLHKNAESLAIEYLSSVIKNHHHESMLLFDPGSGDIEYPTLKNIKFFSEKTIDITIKIFKPDVIMFSLLTNLLPWVSKWARYIKSKYDIPICVGGVYPIIHPDYIISKDFVDFICVGEGELMIEKLIETFNGKLQLENVPNIWYKKKDKENEKTVIVKNQMLPLISNLDLLPFPDKDIFYEYGTFSDRYYIMTSRGCPNACTYCINHQLKDIYKNLGKYMRRRSPENVIEELKWAYNKYHFKEVFFYDDIFSSDLDWLNRFRDLLSTNNIKIKYKCLVHPNFINEQIAQILKETGCIDVDIGIESGSDFIRRNVFHRYMSNNQILHSINILKQKRIRVSTLNILGNPYERYEDIITSAKFNLKLKPSGILFNSLYPYPKTKIYYMCKDLNMISEESDTLIHQGYSSFRQSSLITLTYKDLIERIQIFVPILNKTPKFLWSLIIRLPPNRFFRILSIPFLTSFHNAKLKMKEFIVMQFKSWKKIKKIEAGIIQ